LCNFYYLLSFDISLVNAKFFTRRGSGEIAVVGDILRFVDNDSVNNFNSGGKIRRMSISNSNDRLPKLPFGKIWLLIGISLILFIVGWDFFWLTNNVMLLPNDDENLWSYHRRRVQRENKSVVLIGSSRMQMGFDQNKFTELTGRKTIQLAVVGESPIPLLQNLAEDETFHGTIISDFSEYLNFQKELYPDYPSLALARLKHYQKNTKRG
jgi:hypothetical protein